MRTILFTFALVGVFVYPQLLQAQMNSTSYQIRWDAISTGASDTSGSASYVVRDSLDQSDGSRMSSTSYLLDQGYRAGVFDQVLTFDVFAEDMTAGRAATAFSGLTVTASTSGLSVGQFIAVIQNQGSSQVEAIGKISSMTADTATVDSWKTSGTDPVIDGTNDYVYLLNGSTIALGQLSSGVVATSIVAFDVSVDDDGGYVVQILEDGELRFGLNTIDDIADGLVSAGSEEYGARSSDSTLSGSTFDTVDTAITSTYQDVASESFLTYNSRNFMTIKASYGSNTNAGSYAHTLTFIASGNF